MAHSFAHLPAPSPASSSTSFPQASRDTSFVPEASGLGDPFASRKKSCVVGIKPGSATRPAQDALNGKHHDDWKISVEARWDCDGVQFDDTDAAVSKSAFSGMAMSVVTANHKKLALAMIATTGQRNMHAPGFTGTSPVNKATGDHGNEPQLPSQIVASGNGWNA